MTYKFDTVRSVLVRKKKFCWSTYPSTCKFCMCLFVHPFVKMTAAFTMESLSQGLHELFWYCNCCCQIFISRIAQSILGWRELTCQMKVYGDIQFNSIQFIDQLRALKGQQENCIWAKYISTDNLEKIFPGTTGLILLPYSHQQTSNPQNHVPIN